MIMYVCAVWDKAVEGYGVPFFTKHQNEAVRSFTDEVNRDGSVFGAHPGDYDLFFLGTYDDAAGTFDTAMPSRIATGASVRVAAA